MTGLDVVVPAGGRLTAGGLHAALVPAGGEVTRFDLRRAGWIEPVGLVLLASLAERERAAGRDVRLHAPDDGHIARYAARMRLGEVLDGLGHSHDLPPVQATDRATDLLELRRFEGAAQADALGALVFERTRGDLRLARALHQSIAETCVNVPDHARQPGGWVAAQTTYRGTVVHFAVGDGGVGVAGGFRPAQEYDDGEALRQVLELGRSRLGPGHGRGLSRCKQVVLAGGGSLHMVSGRAYRTVTAAGTVSGLGSTAYPGTLLQGALAVPQMCWTGGASSPLTSPRSA